jgi:hypothetical protein
MGWLWGAHSEFYRRYRWFRRAWVSSIPKAIVFYFILGLMLFWEQIYSPHIFKPSQAPNSSLSSQYY